MKVICQDSGGTQWEFENGRYFRKDGSGTILGRISGANLPDPFKMWAARCENHGVPMGTEELNEQGKSVRLKPSEAVFNLWSHWNADNDH